MADHAPSPEHVSLAVGGTPFDVVSLRGEDRLSRLFAFRVVCRGAEGGTRADALVGRGAEITLRDGFGNERTITGLCSEASIETHDDGSAAITLDVRPEVYPLTLGRGCRVFEQQDVAGIAAAVLAGKRFRLALTRSYPVRVYTAQYRESDWTFLCRLLEEEGIYAWFDHEGSTTLVLADDSRAAPDLAGGAHVAFHHRTGMHADREVIEEMGSEIAVTPTRFTVSSFDPHRPALQVASSTGGGPLEIYHAPGGGPESPAVCAARAATMAEAAAAAGSGIAGRGNSVRMVPGMVMEVSDHPLASLDGRYLVTEVSYEATQRRQFGGGGDGEALACRFRAIRAQTPYRPPAETPPGKQTGLQTGVVVGTPGAEIHTHSFGTVRVQHHWDREGKRDDASGKWMRVAQRGTEESMLLPRIGWTVLTFNEEGTIDAPAVLSRIHDGEHLPPYGLPANKTRVVFKTATSPGGGSHNEIYFEDKRGAEEMFIHASKDHNVLVQHVKRESVLRDSARQVGVDHKLTVGQDKTEAVKVNHSVTVGATETATIHGNRSKTVQGNESHVIVGSRNLHAASSSVNAKHTRSLSVGAALLDITLGTQRAAAAGIHTVMVGGVAVKVSGKSIAMKAGKVAVQTVGGAKLEFSQKNRAIDVRKNLLETVGGGIVLQTEGEYLDRAEETSKFTVGGVLTGGAPEILVEAKDKIELRCGKSLIRILPDSVEIRAATFDLSKCSNLFSTTQTIEHN